jgi:hypothetical protein
MKNLLYFLLFFANGLYGQQYCGTVLSNITITPTESSQNTPTYSDGRRAFNFSADVGCTYTFSTVGLSSVDTYLRLYSTGTGGTIIVENDDASTNPIITQSTIVWECQTSGIYSIHLSRWRNNGNQCDPLNGSTSMSYIVSCPTPLPVTLTSFTTECDNGTPVLKWTTASEQNSDYFQVERSRDGFEWVVVSKIQAMGNSNSSKDYQFIDMTAGGYFEGYYRLKQVDFDGQFEYFDPKSVKCLNNKNNLDIDIFPNPTKDIFFVGARSEFEGNLTLIVTDQLGRILFSKEVCIKNGYFLEEINLSKCSNGMYNVILTTPGDNYVKKIIKK